MNNKNLFISLLLVILGLFLYVISTQNVFITEPEEIVFLENQNNGDLFHTETIELSPEDSALIFDKFENIYDNKEQEVEEIIVEEKKGKYDHENPGTLAQEVLAESNRDSLCPEEGFRKIHNGESLYISNYCYYREKKGMGNSEECKEKFEDEFIRRRYNIVNECLYDNDKLISVTPLSHSLINGDFGEKYHAEFFNIFVSELLFEWHRFIDENKLYILIAGNAGCGGCWDNGPYLIIDLETGNIEKKFFDFPYLGNVIFSPNGDKLIYINTQNSNFEFNLNNQVLSVLDIPSLSSKEIYEVPTNQSLIDSGYISYFIKDAIIWDSNREVRVAQIKKYDGEDPYMQNYAAYKNGESEQDFYKRYTFLGEPVKVEL
jgi:hypothetical protein